MAYPQLSWRQVSDPSVQRTYVDIASMVADRTNQKKDYIYRVGDTFYQYLSNGTTGSNEEILAGDYFPFAGATLKLSQGFIRSGSNVFTLDFTPLYIDEVTLGGGKIPNTDSLAYTVSGNTVTILWDLIDGDFIEIHYYKKPEFITGIGVTESQSITENILTLQKDQVSGVAANDTSILSLDTVGDLSTAPRINRTRAYVNGGGQGGSTFTYIPAGSGLVADGGIYYNAADGGLFKRDFEGYVFPEWWGGIGNGVIDDYVALQGAFDSGFSVFLNAGKVFAYGTQIIIEDRDEVIISGPGKLKDLGKPINLLTGTTLTSVGVLIQNCQNIVLNDLTFITSNTSSAQVDPASNSQRVPTLDIQNCINVKINGINFSGMVGPFVSFASANTDFELMNASFLRIYQCNVVRLTDGRILGNSGAGESFCINLSTNVFIQNCGFLESTGNKTFGLFKIINCENVIADGLYTEKSSGISSFIDVIGKNFEIRNTHINNPTGKFLDISKEWVEDNETDNISVINCSGDGEGIRCAIQGTKVERIKNVIIDNFDLNRSSTDATITTCTEFDNTIVRNCNLVNPFRVLFYDLTTTNALQNSIVENFRIEANASALVNTFRCDSGKGTQVWRNGVFDFGYFKELRIGDYIDGTGKDLSLSRDRFTEFVGVVFNQMTIVISNNAKFTDCVFINCLFTFNRAVGSLNTNALAEFNSCEIKYDLNYNRTDGLIIQTFGGLLTANFNNCNFTGLLHNTGGRGLLDNIIASTNAYSGTWSFKDCLFDMFRWSGSDNQEQQIFIMSNSVNTSTPISIKLFNCKVTDKMFIGSFRGSTSSGSTNYIEVEIDKTTMESTNTNAFVQSNGTTSLDRIKLTVQNSIFGNEARNRIINASGNTFNSIRYINNIDSLNVSDI